MSSNTDKLPVNWKYLLISLVVALLLWYTLNARDQIERVVDVRLDYKGLPAGLIVTSGQINKISVRLRGPLELLRSLSNRDLAYTMDLSGLTRGNNVIPLTWDPAQDLRALQVLEVMPPRLNLTVDEVMESRVPVVPVLRASPLERSLRMDSVEVDPEQITVRGPASVVASLKQVTAEIPADIDAEGKIVSDDVPILAPPSVDVSPATVNVRRRLLVARRNLSLQRDVIPYDEASEFTIQPSRVSLIVSVPRALANNSEYLSRFQAYVRPSGGETEEETKIPVEITVPQGAKLVRVSPNEVTLSHRPS